MRFKNVGQLPRTLHGTRMLGLLGLCHLRRCCLQLQLDLGLVLLVHLLLCVHGGIIEELAHLLRSAYGFELIIQRFGFEILDEVGQGLILCQRRSDILGVLGIICEVDQIHLLAGKLRRHAVHAADLCHILSESGIVEICARQTQMVEHLQLGMQTVGLLS